MVSTKEALKCMEERAKKKKKIKPTFIPMTSLLLSLFGRGEKRRELELSLRPVREPHGKRIKPQDAKPVFVQFPPDLSICSDLEALLQCFPSLCLRKTKLIYLAPFV